MNEFISNSGTLINPDSVYDQERFINILQIILQKKTQKELSEQTGLNNLYFPLLIQLNNRMIWVFRILLSIQLYADLSSWKVHALR